MKHLISCVCPTFSRPRFVEQAVKTFLRQTWVNSELLIFDDSPKSLQAQIPNHPRIKLFRLAERTPMGEKHNLGLARAHGDFIVHFDDDDWQSPRRLVRQLEALVLGGIDVCGFETDLLLTTGDARFWRFDRTYGRSIGLVGNAIVLSHVPFMDGTAMFRRSVVGKTRYPVIQVGQKVVFLETIWKAGAKLHAITNDGMYVYVRHHTGSSALNTWQYGTDRRLLETPRPAWFPAADLNFYRRAA